MQYGELAAAARAGDVARVRALLAAGADPIPSLPDDNWVYAQFAPLWAAVDGGSIECVRALLDAGAGLQLRDLDPRMPILTHATSVAMVDLLLDAGADPWLKPHTSDSVASGVASNTDVPVETRGAILRRLVEAGVDLDTVHGYHTALWHAACFVEPGAVEALLLGGADPNAPPSALRGACWPSYPGQIEGDADDIERNVDVIVAAGGDLEERDEHGYGPMHGAMMPYNHGEGFASSDGSNAPAVRALIRNGASIDIMFDDRGTGPLHLLASSDGDAATIEVLLAAGANPRQRDADGRTPLDVARARLEQIRELDDSIRELRDTKLIPRAETAIRLLGG